MTHLMGLMAVLAYRPFLDPITALNRVWYLLLFPMALGIAVAYKAVRVHDMKMYWRQVLTMTVQISLGMMALGAASYVLVQHLVPMLAPK